MRVLRSLLPLTVACGLLATATPAAAYVRSYTTQGCHPVFWGQTCIYITPDSAGVPEMALSDVERVVQQSINSWQTRTRDSSFLRMNYLPANAPRDVNSLDGLQVIKFYHEQWCRPAADAMSNPVCYDPAAAALTTVTYINKPTDAATDGRIVDADIELNAVFNYFYDADLNPNPDTGLIRRPADLWNTLTHEIGHLQGLEHTCRRGSFDSMPACTRDGQGNQVISCNVVESGRSSNSDLQIIYETTMYPTADPKETRKRVPHADDLAGVINAYPLVSDPRICKLPEAGVTKGGCSATAGERAPQAGALSATGLLTAALALLILHRRRRAR